MSDKKLNNRIILPTTDLSNSDNFENLCTLYAAQNKEVASTVSNLNEENTKKKKKKLPKKTELLQQIETKDSEIHVLGSKIEELNKIIEQSSIQNLSPTQSFAITKAVKLNKQNNQLKSDLEAMHAEQMTLIQQIDKLEKEMETQKTQDKDVVINPPIQIPCNKFQALQEQFNKTKTKLFDALNQNAKLKNELKLAQKCVQQEIGDNININTLLNSDSPGWRGRAQTILSLKKKVADLKEKLNYLPIYEESSEKLITKETHHIGSYNRVEHENLQNELIKLRELVENQKFRMNALKAHKAVLTEETSKSKEKLVHLLEKSENDDKYIKKLNEQLEAQEHQYQLKSRGLLAKINDMEKLKNELNLNLSTLTIKLENLDAQSSDKSKSICELNEHVKSIEQDLRSVCGDFLFSCREFTKDQFLGLVSRLESEKIELLTLVKTLNDRIAQDRSKLMALHEENGKLKMMNGKLEAKLKPVIHPPGKHAVVSSNVPSPSCNLIEHEQLKYDCESSHERISFLEANVKEIQSEKDLDLKVYSEIIINSKNLMVESIKKDANIFI